MGQYHVVANLDKKQRLFPHKLGDGLKLMEFGTDSYGTMTALAILLVCSNGRGGGDFRGNDSPLIGSWAGDRIAIVGDYAQDSDLAPEDLASTIYDSKEYEDISDLMRQLLESTGAIKFSGNGWLRKVVGEEEIFPSMRPDLVVFT